MLLEERMHRASCVHLSVEDPDGAILALLIKIICLYIIVYRYI